MAQVAVLGPSEAAIGVHGATASPWYEVGCEHMYTGGTRYKHLQGTRTYKSVLLCSVCVCPDTLVRAHRV